MSQRGPAPAWRGETRQLAGNGLWFSVPVLAVATAIWLWGPTGQWVVAAGIGACALALPWGLLTVFPVWLLTSAFGDSIGLAPLYWGIALAVAAGAHLNAYLLLARPGNPPSHGNPAP